MSDSNLCPWVGNGAYRSCDLCGSDTTHFVNCPNYVGATMNPEAEIPLDPPSCEALGEARRGGRSVQFFCKCTECGGDGWVPVGLGGEYRSICTQCDRGYVAVKASPFAIDDEVFDLNVEKPLLNGLFVDNPDTPEGKYLVIGRDGKAKRWPHFVLAATDPMAQAGLRAYADEAQRILEHEPERAAKMGVTQPFIDAVRRRADFFWKYNQEHGDGDAGKGRHRKDDPATVALMREIMASS